MTEQQAEAQRLIIEQQSEERENAIEERKKKIQRDQAEREKQMALLQLAVETAMAVGKIRAQAAVLAANPVTAALAAVAYAQIPIVLASAAVQATTISAQSIPEYAEGTDDHKGGRAIVGDGGRSELIITPSGEVFVTPKTPTLVDLPKHTVVLPDMEKALPLMAMTHLIDRKAQDKIVVAENKRQIQLQEENNHLLKKIAKGNPRLPKSTFITTSGNYIINKNMNYGNN